MSEPIKDNLSVKNLVERYNQPMPDFWKKIQRIMLTIGGIGAALIASAAAVTLPPIVLTIAGYFIAVGAVGTALTQLTTPNASQATPPNIEPPPTNKNPLD